MNISEFCSKSHISGEIVRAVVRKVGGWEDFCQIADDVSNHGANAGWSGFTYYRDTESFTKLHKHAILDLAKQMSDDLGEDLYTMIGGFNCLKITASEAAEAIHNPRSEERTNVFNALAWFALEEVARSYADATERTA